MTNRINKSGIPQRPDTDQVSKLSNHKSDYDFERVILPLPPAAASSAQADEAVRFEMEIYARFMRHLRYVPNNRMEIKILSAIQFTADMLEESDALVSKMLVDLGLKAPRKAFPVAFLDFADKCAARRAHNYSTTPVSVMKLIAHWNHIGEDRFANVMPGQYAVYNEDSHIGA